MRKQTTKTWINPESSALPITQAELENLLGIKLDIDNLDDIHGNLKTYGYWSLPISYRALAMATLYSIDRTHIISETAYGLRTMTNCRQSGYNLEGYVSINGKKYSCFTSSQLFELENGKLINVAVIHARIK